jgi:hypothetical protein
MVKFLAAAAWTQGIVHRSTAIVASFVVTLVAASLGMIGTAAAQSQSMELAKTRAALEKYQDPLVAVRDGYFSTVGCVHYADGGMGVHFINAGLISPTPDPLKPQILVYEPDGAKLRLVAAEWFVPLATGVKERPTLFGQPFDGPMEGHEPLMPADLHHYDLHVWLFKENPAGMFKSINPNVKCTDAAGYSLLETPTKMVPHPVAK